MGRPSMRLRLNLRHLMIAGVAVALLASIAVSMARSSARPVETVQPTGPGSSTITIEESYEIPLIPLVATVVGAWWLIRRLPTRRRTLAAAGIGLSLAAYVILVMQLLQRYR